MPDLLVTGAGNEAANGPYTYDPILSAAYNTDVWLGSSYSYMIWYNGDGGLFQNYTLGGDPGDPQTGLYISMTQLGQYEMGPGSSIENEPPPIVTLYDDGGGGELPVVCETYFSAANDATFEAVGVGIFATVFDASSENTATFTIDETNAVEDTRGWGYCPRSLPWRHQSVPADKIVVGVFHGLVDDFDDIAAAGFNTVIAPTFTVTNQTIADVVAAAETANLDVVPILKAVPQVEDVELYDSNDKVAAWYVYDEPNTKANWAERLTNFQGFLDSWDADKPLMVCCNYASANEYRDRFRAFASESEIVCHDNYPYRHGLFPRAWTFDSPTGLLVNGQLAQDIAEAHAVPHWVVTQAHGEPYRHGGLCQPGVDFLRAQAYTSLIKGATGIIFFSMDNWYLRSANLYGMAPDPPRDYGQGGLVISDAQAYESYLLWEGAKTLAAEIAAMQSVWLGTTSPVDYTLGVKEVTYTWSDHPVQSVLKEYDGAYWLIMANIENFAHPVRVTLPFTVASVTRQFGPTESRNGNSLEVYLPPWGTYAVRIDV